jgi:hypothetical protein
MVAWNVRRTDEAIRVVENVVPVLGELIHEVFCRVSKGHGSLVSSTLDFSACATHEWTRAATPVSPKRTSFFKTYPPKLFVGRDGFEMVPRWAPSSFSTAFMGWIGDWSLADLIVALGQRATALRVWNRLALVKSDPISLDTVSTTMTGAKEVDDGNKQAEADSWQ